MLEPTPPRRVRLPLRTTAPAIAAIFVLSGIATAGVFGALIGLGLVLLVTGLGALAVGRARWARISGRRTAGIVAGIGVVALIGGCAGAPAPHRTAVGAASASLAADESAIHEAEASLAAAEGNAAPGVGNVPAESLLSDGTTATKVSFAAASSPASALAALSAIPVKGRAPMTGYSRAQFGDGWVDTDRNGCDTRNDVLHRDLTGATVKPGTHDCVVLTGSLADPYSGRDIAFQRGARTSSAVQIDHVVALGDAWQTGAQSWDTARRTAFANDPRELLAVDGPLNEQKGDGDAATWLPPNKAYRCTYVARQVAVKVAYGLWMTQAEKDASATVLSACPEQALPDGVVAAVATPAPTTTTAPTTPAPATTRAPAPRTTTAPKAPAPAPAPAPSGTVTPGAYCSSAGATGVTVKGTAMVCKTSATDVRLRWRSAG